MRVYFPIMPHVTTQTQSNDRQQHFLALCRFFVQPLFITTLFFVFLMNWSGMYAAVSPPVRAAYVGIAVLKEHPELLARLREHGFTLVLVADGDFRLQDDIWQNIDKAEEEISSIAVIHFAVPAELRDQPGSYRPYVNRNGVVYAKTPCPTDAGYWRAVIGDRFIELAKMVSENVVGVAFDVEMYGSDINWYADLCYCDTCWQMFYDSALTSFPDRTKDIPAESRFTFLMQHNLLQTYTTFQWNQVRSILAGFEQEAHQLRPQIRLGFLCYRHNWFFTALVHGLGTVENPVLVFSESSYVRGYTPHVDIERDHVLRTQLSAHNQQIAEYVPGIWLERFSPATLLPQIVDLALHADGYWLYTSGRFWTDAPETEEWRLNGPNADYWTTMQQAHAELERISRLPVVHRREIAPVKQSSFYDVSQQRLLTTPELHSSLAAALEKSAYPEIPAQYSDQDAPIIYRGQTLFHCLSPGTGLFTVTHMPLGKDVDPDLIKTPPNLQQPIVYRIFNSQGTLAHSGTVKPSESPEALTLPDDVADMTSLLISSDTNGAQVSFSGMSCVAEASSTFPLSTYRTSWHGGLYLPPGTVRLNFRMHSPPHESALVMIQPPSPQSAKQITTQRFRELHILNAASQVASRWTIRVEPAPPAPFGDVRVYLYDAAFPYLWLSQ